MAVVFDLGQSDGKQVIAVDGQFGLVYGTSASSPAFGSIITLINDKLLSKSKSTVGFIDSVLYANPQVLNDITEGANPGCGTDSFNATTGWDPVTGLGTLNCPMMLSLFEGLQ
jgi:tripeptidyl-peptidase-1